MFDKSIGSFTGIDDNTNLPVKGILLIPPTKIQHYLTITINAIEIDKVPIALEKIPSIQQYIKNIAEKIPVPVVSGTINLITDVVASLVNLVGLLNVDDTIMHNERSFILGQEAFPGLESSRYLTAGLTQIKEIGEYDKLTMAVPIILKRAKT